MVAVVPHRRCSSTHVRGSRACRGGDKNVLVGEITLLSICQASANCIKTPLLWFLDKQTRKALLNQSRWYHTPNKFA